MRSTHNEWNNHSSIIYFVNYIPALFLDIYPGPGKLQAKTGIYNRNYFFKCLF